MKYMRFNPSIDINYYYHCNSVENIVNFVDLYYNFPYYLTCLSDETNF